MESKNEDKSLLGCPIKPGYQSHYVITEISGDPVKEKKESGVFDEIVLGQEAQVLPVYLIEFDGPKLVKLATEVQRDAMAKFPKPEERREFNL